MTVILVLTFFSAFWIVELLMRRRRLVAVPLSEDVELVQVAGGKAASERRQGERRSGTTRDRRKAA